MQAGAQIYQDSAYGAEMVSIHNNPKESCTSNNKIHCKTVCTFARHSTLPNVPTKHQGDGKNVKNGDYNPQKLNTLHFTT
jgi:hypothetical protein